MSLKTLLGVFYAIILLVTFSFGTKTSMSNKRPLEEKQISMFLRFGHVDSVNTLSLDKNDTNSVVQFLIKNNTDSLATFYETWNAWGFFNFKFEMIVQDSVFKATRYTCCIDRNFPSAIMLFPGDSMEFSMKTVACDTSRRWDCFWGFPSTKLKQVKIRAVYSFWDVIDEPRDTMQELYMSFIYSYHPGKFKKLTKEQKLRSFVKSKFYSPYYLVDIRVHD